MSLNESNIPRSLDAAAAAAACTHTHHDGHSHTHDIVNESSSYPFTLSKNSTLKDYLIANQINMNKLKTEHPEIMPRSAKGQQPHTLWIGCADSRINECTALGCLPGEIFTLRNISNVINHEDVASMSALQFAIDVLKVKKIIVCGHTDCGGVWASLSNKKAGGYLDQWLNRVRQVRSENLEELKKFDDINDKCKRLVELNVLNSVDSIKQHPSFVEAFAKGDVELYGLVYDVESGYLREIPLDDDATTDSILDNVLQSQPENQY